IGNQGNAQAIGGTVTITNSLGFTNVTVDDSADAASRSVTLDTFTPEGDREYGRVRGLAAAEIDYRNAETSSATVKAGQLADNIDIVSTGVDTTVSGGGEADVITAGAVNNNLDQVRGRLTIDGGAGANTLKVNDQANANPSTWEVTGATVDR